MKAMLTTLLYARCTIGFVIFLIGFRIARLGIHALPSDHPGRIYAEGRIDIGAERISQVFCPRAAARHKANRRYAG